MEAATERLKVAEAAPFAISAVALCVPIAAVSVSAATSYPAVKGDTL